MNLKHAIIANGGVQAATAVVSTFQMTARYSFATSLSSVSKHCSCACPCVTVVQTARALNTSGLTSPSAPQLPAPTTLHLQYQTPFERTNTPRRDCDCDNGGNISGLPRVAQRFSPGSQCFNQLHYNHHRRPRACRNYQASPDSTEASRQEG